MKNDVRFNFESSSKNETSRLKIKEFDGSILSQMGNRFNEKFDEKMDRQGNRFSWQVVIKNFSVELKPVKNIDNIISLKFKFGLMLYKKKELICVSC